MNLSNCYVQIPLSFKKKKSVFTIFVWLFFQIKLKILFGYLKLFQKKFLTFLLESN